MPAKAKLFLSLVVILGAVLIGFEFTKYEVPRPQQLLPLLVMAVFASGLKVTLPGVTGTMSVYFLFLLIAMVRLSTFETILIGLSATIVQCLWHARSRPAWFQILFNLGSTSIAVVASCETFRSLRLIGTSDWTKLGLAASVFFVLNTAPVAAIIGLTEQKSSVRVWKDCYFWCFPYYMIGAAFAGLYDLLSREIGWDGALFVIPFVYLIFRSYRQYLSRLEGEKSHAQQVADLHLRTIEALALAIDAKDHNTHEHLQRVQVYAMAIARELKLTEQETEALRAAALLHDIGKLAVPEHIISKPGRLTPEEFEKVKIHPRVGAEILERVKFPYPVAPIVLCHHEKWDGTGYPSQLKGEAIPIGARILSAVDCLDALASDRQYRRALPLDQALAYVVNESGKAFDPRVIRILKERSEEFECKCKSLAADMRCQLSDELNVEVEAAPDAGFARNARSDSSFKPDDFLNCIAAARQEVQALFELAQELGQSLSLNETLSVLASRLKNMVPYSGLAIYVVKEEKLVPAYVTGQDFKLFSSLEIPIGQGLSGWVVENRKAIVNGNPSVEPGYLNDAAKFSTLQSALAVPLEGPNGVVGALALYHADRDAFSIDQLRILQAIGPKLCASIENALEFSEAKDSATTDFLTGLPNARSLFLHLDSEISRAKRSGKQLAVLVCDLDGFKQVNDRFGHLSGNRLLSLLAVRMQETCRNYDYVARMGGDEFTLILPDITEEASRRKIVELDRIAREAGIEVCGESIVSLSVGAARYPADGADAEDLLADADRKMYRRKQSRASSHQPTHQLATLLAEVTAA